ncbi:hypothetical protein BC939DRAFT_463975 [Gamsiella multidivaricata]|uniref:uncharacterized protein n=1 Tax=Gamsiella multidivaricata TaxID=101098 RepID=UPI0022211526|nr:uncharacterized protein BC939DRAFT_463975 [Gamsiella multidivaricata]KAG0351510.1 hypothetical protein BGZ54_003209 [Gamsiella multidivaricata]KAI7818094.1 hypothetical protein BC939DRAFT_463975 [Gamsiella multidivaricata]
MASQHCQFFSTKKGCRNGAACRFLHTAPSPQPASSAPRTATASTATAAPTRTTATIARAPVRKPLPKQLRDLSQDQTAASLRTYEISQIESRFSSSFVRITDSNSDQIADIFQLKITPSDPDFPYEIESLHIQLTVPKDYPQSPCSVEVLNKDIPKGYATNLERGFAEATRQKKSLLAHLNWLDVNMEELLQKPPAPTIRFVGHGQQANTASAAKSARVSTSNGSATPTTEASSSSSAPLLSSSSSASSFETPVKPTPVPASQPPKPVQPTFTSQQIEQASLQRQKQLAQIQARFRSSFSTISATEVEISLESADKPRMPVSWQGPLWISLLVPTKFPLEPCEIRLKQDGHNPEIELWRARNVEQGFRKMAAAMPQLSLFQLLNQLNRDLKEFMNMPAPAPPSAPIAPLEQPSLSQTASPSSSASKSAASPDHAPAVLHRDDTSKPRLIYVDPPKQLPTRNFEQGEDNGMVTSEDDSSDNDDDDDDNDPDGSEHGDVHDSNADSATHSEEDDDDDEQDGQSSITGGPIIDAAPKRGIEIRMPDLKLEHISLLYCRSLNLLVRCNRCKGLFDIPDLLPDDNNNNNNSASVNPSGGDKRKWRTCDNCQSLLGAHFRTEYIHIQSRTIGYLDLAGCTAYDILPSAFVPTCSECDTVLGSGADMTAHVDSGTTLASTEESFEAPGRTVTTRVPTSTAPTGFRQRIGRGMSATANCRKCHARLILSIEGDLKFIKLSPGDLMRADASTLSQLPLKKKKPLKNKNGLDFELKVGEPLPRKGACDHYKKSRRWFRFPCCSKIYPCHMCHDEKEGGSHECEYAKRMVCGHCSREQTVSDKPCVCGESPIKTMGGSGAFWEGGEGMRDKTRMSNKDSKKHKGAHKTMAKKQVGAENARKRIEKSKASRSSAA